MVEAGAAYREAALDPANPAPAKSLVNLGVCFMELGRPEDAVSVYETALDFDLDDRARAKAYANLGQAYMAQGRVPRALDAFEKAEEIGDEMPSLAMHDYELARTLKERVDSRAPGILDTGYIPPVATDVSSPEDDEDFDPFAPRTGEQGAVSAGTQAAEPTQQADAGEAAGETLDPSRAQTIAMEALPTPLPDNAASDADATGKIEVVKETASVSQGDAAEQAYDSGLDETPFTYNEQPGYEYGVAFDFGDEYADVRESADLMDSTEMHMPSPEDTAFFDITEQQIKNNARKGKRQDRKARGCGLKIAIAFVIVCILVAGAAVAAYVLGYGYPLQETVTEDFFAAVQNDGDTSQYWAKDVSPSMQRAQEASLQDLTSYSVEAVQRSMNQTAVFVNATLAQGGNIDYEVVLTRDGISWAIQFVQLYFPSEQ